MLMLKSGYALVLVLACILAYGCTVPNTAATTTAIRVNVRIKHDGHQAFIVTIENVNRRPVYLVEALQEEYRQGYNQLPYLFYQPPSQALLYYGMVRAPGDAVYEAEPNRFVLTRLEPGMSLNWLFQPSRQFGEIPPFAPAFPDTPKRMESEGFNWQERKIDSLQAIVAYFDADVVDYFIKTTSLSREEIGPPDHPHVLKLVPVPPDLASRSDPVVTATMLAEYPVLCEPIWFWQLQSFAASPRVPLNQIGMWTRIEHSGTPTTDPHIPPTRP